MTYVVIAEDDLLHKRPTSIRRLLQPLAIESSVACDSPKGLYDGGRILAAHDGQISGKVYRDWRFKSKHRDIFCQYFELWKPSSTHRKWFLDRAYLTLFLTDRTLRQERELLCVHSDPNCNDSEPMRSFKTGPHLHVKHLQDPLPHSHFPLTIGYIDKAIQSTPELTRVFMEVATLLSVEVVGRFENA